MTNALRYGLEFDRDYLMDIAFRLYTIAPIISSLTIYPANFYLITVGIPGMKFELRAAYTLNLIAHVTFDWTFSVFVRVYQFPPYGLFYCEGWFSALGLSKHIIMGVLAWSTTATITVFFILMLQLHQLTVHDNSSRWRLSTPVQAGIYALLTAFCLTNVAGFVAYGEDVGNYEELVQDPDLAWLVERGGTLLLFAQPGVPSAFIMELCFMLVSFAIFAPFLSLYIAHALIYLRKRELVVSQSNKTRLLTRRLFDTFSTQLVGATLFFIIPLTFILVTSVHGIVLSELLPGPVFAALRFISILLLVLDAAQFSLVFFIRCSIHRQISLMAALRYGFELDREHFLDIAFRMNTIMPFVSSLTIYPAHLYLLTAGIPGMKSEIRAAYIINLVAHVMFDWTYCFLARAYQFPPYGLFYCEGWFSALGLSKRIIMASLAWTATLSIAVFFILMVQLHQLTVVDSKSRWKLSIPIQTVIYSLLGAFCFFNVVGFVVFGADVENYEELVKEADLAWLVQRGGTLLLFGEPGKTSQFRMELRFLLLSTVIFLPCFSLYVAHALIYLRKNRQHVVSTKTQLLTKRLFDTFSTQLVGATFFFIIPLAFVLTSSVHGIYLSQLLPGPLYAALRFCTTEFLVLDAAQFSLVFIVRSATHRKIILQRLRRFPVFKQLGSNVTQRAITTVTG